MLEWFVRYGRVELEQFGGRFQQQQRIGRRKRFEQFGCGRFVRVCRSVVVFALANQWPGQQRHTNVHGFEQLRNGE